MSRTRRKTETARVIRFFIHVTLVVLLDQLIKLVMQYWLAEGQSHAVIPNVFHLTLVYNTGIAFGLFQEHGVVLLLLISLSLIALAVVARSMAGQGPMAQMSMALIFGGAIGNWMDRIRVHAVIDYLDFRIWPVFNLADSAITVGVVLYLWLALGFSDPFHKAPAKTPPPQSNP